MHVVHGGRVSRFVPTKILMRLSSFTLDWYILSYIGAERDTRRVHAQQYVDVLVCTADTMTMSC